MHSSLFHARFLKATRWLLAIPALLAPACPAVAGEGADALSRFLDRVRTLEAAFEQTLYDEDGAVLEEAGGRFYLRRPDRFRWRYDKPYLQDIVADGKRVWIYDSELEQVTVKTLTDAIGNSPALVLSTNRPLEQDFLVQELPARGGLARVALRPRNPDSSFVEVRMGFDGGTLSTMELVDSFAQTTVLQFVSSRLNEPLAPELFRFEPPPGADVFEDN